MPRSEHGARRMTRSVNGGAKALDCPPGAMLLRLVKEHEDASRISLLNRTYPPAIFERNLNSRPTFCRIAPLWNP